MDIVIIGSGNVAAVLGRKFLQAGHRIVQVLSRNASAASELAYEWDTESANYMSLINRQADIYLIAVSDDAVASVAAELQLPGKVVAHTAAAVPVHVLSQVTTHYGVFYPLQTLRKESTSLPDIPFYIDGSDAVARQKLHALAASVMDHQPATAGDDQRARLHVAAVLVNNFVNHLYVLAEEFCQREGIDFKELLPLVNETAARISQVSPKQAQTGPAIRPDETTLKKHLEILEAYPALKDIYQQFTDSIQRVKYEA